MQIHSTLRMGAFHSNHCEDFLIYEPAGTQHWLFAVMDGCTMGRESHFAAVLCGKLLRKIAKKHFYLRDFDAAENNAAFLKVILKELMLELKQIKNGLDLEVNELLTTLVLALVDTKEKNAEVITIGDGLVSIDGKITVFDQNDKPDYLGYHLADDFEPWYKRLDQRISIRGFKELGLTTDGIFTFRKKQGNTAEDDWRFHADFLLHASTEQHPNWLTNQVNDLTDNGKWILNDDLAIIRIISA